MQMIEFSKDKTPGEYAPLVLAYIGDAIYEVYVRSRIIAENPQLPAHKLHKAAIGFVKAHAQSTSVEKLEPMLTEAEAAVYRRGRNAKSPTVPKNADIVDYRRATGFEALVGWLYLSGMEDRLKSIMSAAYEGAVKES